MADRAEQKHRGSGYAHRLTNNGERPWIGGSRLEYQAPNLKARLFKSLDKAMAEARKAKH